MIIIVISFWFKSNIFIKLFELSILLLFNLLSLSNANKNLLIISLYEISKFYNFFQIALKNDVLSSKVKI